MAVLFIAETTGADLPSEELARALSAVKALGEVSVLVIGSRAAADAVARFDGVTKVMVADDSAYEHGLAEPVTNLIVSLAVDFEHIAAASTAYSKNVLPRVAALLDVMIMSDVTKVIDGATFERPVYAGNALQTVQSRDEVKVFTIRASVFEPVSAGAGSDAPVEVVSAVVDPMLTEWVEDQIATSDRPELTTASIVVSGGRGVGSRESFAHIEKLADKLGAAIGASRAAVDAGFVSNEYQVGQTGKIVAPDVYIAVGISGAIQHLAGMKDSKVIVAINKDADAPIFDMADFGLVADLFTALPELIEKL